MPTSTMTYAFYREMPDHLVCQALKMLPDWKVDVNERFDARCVDFGTGVKTVVLS